MKTAARVIELQELANSTVTLRELGHRPGAWTCPCVGCQLIRAGACLSCAARVTAEIARGKSGDEVRVAVCGGACQEALERWLQT
jgi:hypothetical protein